MADESGEERDAVTVWSRERQTMRHSDQVRAILARMPRPVVVPDASPVAVLDELRPADIIETHDFEAATEIVEPEVVESVATEPEVVEPEVVESVATEPEVVEPEVVEPEDVEPVVAEPVVAEPVVAEPVVAEPVVAEPVVAERVVAAEPAPARAAGETFWMPPTPAVPKEAVEAADAPEPRKKERRKEKNERRKEKEEEAKEEKRTRASRRHASAAPGPVGMLETAAHIEAPRRRRRLRRALTVLLVVALLAGVAAAVLVYRHRTSRPAAQWDRRVLPIVQFVEQERGLSFTHPVPVEFLADAAFNRAVRVPQPNSTKGLSQMNEALHALRALGLVSGNLNLASSLDTLNQADVIGLYVPQRKTVFVRGSALTPFVRVTLAHELTHALQDQHFDLTRLESSVRAGDDTALTALEEGDAVRVQNAYVQTLSTSDQALYAQENKGALARSGQASSVPAILTDMASFPYVFGPTFVDSLVAQGGISRLDAAFHTAPVTDAQILDPAQYPLTWHPLPVPRPAIPAGAGVLDTASPFGQAALFEVLGSRLPYQQAWPAVQGWQGDNSVPYSDHGRTCVAIDVRMGTPAQAAALAGAGAAWAHGVPGATVTPSGTLVSIRSCDPGPSATIPAPASPSAFDVLSARSAVIDSVITSGSATFSLGSCVADGVITALGPAGYAELTADTLSSAQQQALLQLATAAGRQCQGQGTT